MSIEAGRFPIGVFKISSDDYVASLMACTHQACKTQIKDNGYICPCHGSRFDNPRN